MYFITLEIKFYVNSGLKGWSCHRNHSFLGWSCFILAFYSLKLTSAHRQVYSGYQWLEGAKIRFSFSNPANPQKISCLKNVALFMWKWCRPFLVVLTKKGWRLGSVNTHSGKVVPHFLRAATRYIGAGDLRSFLSASRAIVGVSVQ